MLYKALDKTMGFIVHRVRGGIHRQFYAWFLNWPSRMFFYTARYVYWSHLMKALGVNVRFSDHIKVVGPQGISIGDHVKISNRVILDGRGGLEVRDYCLIGFESILLTSTHMSEKVDVPIMDQGAYRQPICLERNVWLGTRVIVLPGVTIGENTIIGAGAVVTEDIPAGVVAGGVPARVIRPR